MASDETTLLIDPLSMEDFNPVARLMADESRMRVIHNAPFERRILRQEGMDIRNVYDTLVASREIYGRKTNGGHGLAAVCERELGVSLDKSCQRSNWSRRPLSRAQLRYAATDAEVLPKLYRALKGKDPRLGLGI